MSKKIVVEKIVDYIEKHLDEEISLNKIAKDLNYSKFYIARIFAEQTEKTIYKYVQGRRLTLAAQKLIETDYCTNVIFGSTRSRKGYSIIY